MSYATGKISPQHLDEFSDEEIRSRQGMLQQAKHSQITAKHYRLSDPEKNSVLRHFLGGQLIELAPSQWKIIAEARAA